MIKATQKRSVVITLELAQEDAEWLKNYLQNGMPNEERYTQRKREEFWIALNEALAISKGA